MDQHNTVVDQGALVTPLCVHTNAQNVLKLKFLQKLFVKIFCVILVVQYYIVPNVRKQVDVDFFADQVTNLSVNDVRDHMDIAADIAITITIAADMAIITIAITIAADIVDIVK